MGILEKFKNNIKKHDTAILTGIGLVDGLIVGGYLWYKTGVKVNNIIKTKEQEKGSKLTFKEKAASTWKMFIIPSINTALSATAIIVSDKISAKRFASLGMLYSLTETTLHKYQDKVIEEVGENKAEKIKSAVTEEIVKSDYESCVVIDTGYGTTPIKEPISGVIMLTNWDRVDLAVQKANDTASLGDGKVSVSYLFREYNIPLNAMSDRMGWDINKYGRIKINHTCMLDNKERPCGAIDYYDLPYEI